MEEEPLTKAPKQERQCDETGVTVHT
jgi:hypothetical protein